MKKIKKIKFATDQEWCDFNKYRQVRGDELYLQLADWICLEKKISDISFATISNWVRYDKSLKDVLYIFLATLEEYFKTEIQRNLALHNNTIIHQSKKIVDNRKIFLMLNNWSREQKKLTNKKVFIGLWTYFQNWTEKNNEVIGIFNSEIISRINKIRNKVMHLSFLVLPIYNNSKDDVSLYEELNFIKNVLPEPWNKYFVEKINLCKYDSDEDGDKTIKKQLEFDDLVMEDLLCN